MIKNFFFFLAMIIVGLLIIVILLISIFFFTITRPFDYGEVERLPLPLEVGGTLEFEILGEIDLELFDLAVLADFVLSFSPEQINNALPDKAFSILVQETDNENVSSMLGRLEFVPGTVDVKIVDSGY